MINTRTLETIEKTIRNLSYIQHNMDYETFSSLFYKEEHSEGYIREKWEQFQKDPLKFLYEQKRVCHIISKQIAMNILY